MQFNVSWRNQFTYLDYSEFVSFDLVSNFVKDQNDVTLSKKYLELKKARKVLGIMEDHRTVRWILGNETLCQESLRRYARECGEDNYLEVENYVPGNNLS